MKQFNDVLKSQRGFSLAEILIALTLLGLVATFATRKLTSSLHQGRVRSTKGQMRTLIDTINQFASDCNAIPAGADDLGFLMEKGSIECEEYQPGGYINKIPKDGWNREFIFEPKEGGKFTITSLGKDGAEGGEEFDADISSDSL